MFISLAEEIRMSLFDIIMNTTLFEMAYERKAVMDKIRSVSIKLAEKMVLLHHCDKSSSNIQHWITSTNGHLDLIFQFTFLKGNKRLSKKDIFTLLVEDTFGDYDDYIRRYRTVVKLKNETAFSDASSEDYLTIKRQLEKIVDAMLISKTDAPEYEDIVK